MLVVVGDTHHSDHRALPDILMIELGYGHVEMVAQLVLQAAKNLTFILQRSRVGNVEFQGEKADWHFALRASGPERFFAARSTARAARLPFAPKQKLPG